MTEKRAYAAVTAGAEPAYDSVMTLLKAFTDRKENQNFVESFSQIRNFSGVIGDLSFRSGRVIWSEAAIKTI